MLANVYCLKCRETRQGVPRMKFTDLRLNQVLGYSLDERTFHGILKFSVCPGVEILKLKPCFCGNFYSFAKKNNMNYVANIHLDQGQYFEFIGHCFCSI